MTCIIRILLCVLWTDGFGRSGRTARTENGTRKCDLENSRRHCVKECYRVSRRSGCIVVIAQNQFPLHEFRCTIYGRFCRKIPKDRPGEGVIIKTRGEKSETRKQRACTQYPIRYEIHALRARYQTAICHGSV